MKTLNVDNTYKSNTNLTINELLQENKKIVSFIGASQSGTSFLVNNIARIMARRNFDVAEEEKAILILQLLLDKLQDFRKVEKKEKKKKLYLS